jgi:hypothetical protein
MSKNGNKQIGTRQKWPKMSKNKQKVRQKWTKTRRLAK